MRDFGITCEGKRSAARGLHQPGADITILAGP